MEIVHDEAKKQFKVEVDGYTAHVAYQLTEDGGLDIRQEDGGLDIRHTIVPEEIGGRGIASALVKAAYDYARCKCLKPVATCSYAVIWLQRHPEYQGDVSCDYGGKGTCAI